MSFTVAAKFESEAAAQEAKTTIIELFEAIIETRIHRGKQDYCTYWDDNPTWAELEFSQKYELKWDKSLRWVEDPKRQVTCFRDHLFISSSQKGEYPNLIAELLKKLSVEVFVAGLLNGEYIILTEINCKAPDTESAVELAAEINLYLLSEENEFLIPPWEMYSPYLELYDWDLVREPQDKPDLAAVKNAMHSLYMYQKARLEGRSLIGAEKKFISAMVLLRDQGYTFPRGLNEELLPLMNHSIGGRTDTSTMGIKLEVKENLVRMPELFFFRPQLGIPAIYEYLDDKGFTDFEFSLQSVAYGSKREYF